MPRGGQIKKREVIPDPLYSSRLVTRFTNRVMFGGKKKAAQKIIYGALDKLSSDKKEALALFEQGVKNVMPLQEVRPRRVGGATYQVPMPVRHDRSEALAIRWLIQAAKNRKGQTMLEKLATEIKEASEGKGEAIRKKETVHKMADANRAFAHFRW